MARETGVALGDPCAPGTRKERGLPHNPTRLGEDLSAFRRVNGLSCAFHDPRRTLATMMIAGGCDVRTVASCLGARERVDGPGRLAGVDPDAKRAAVDKVADPLDVDLDPLCDFPSPATAPSAGAGALTLSVEQLRAMLAAAEEKEAGHGRP